MFPDVNTEQSSYKKWPYVCMCSFSSRLSRWWGSSCCRVFVVFFPSRLLNRYRSHLFSVQSRHSYLTSMAHCSKTSLSVFQSDTEDDGAEDEVVELFTTPRTKLSAATSDFGYNLFRALASRDPKSSVLLSPMSISAAFTQLSMGSRNSLISCNLSILQFSLILKGPV